MNKICRYCPHCDLVITHQNELDEIITRVFTLGSPGFMKPGDKPIHTEEISLISSVEICSPGRFSFKMSEPWVFTVLNPEIVGHKYLVVDTLENDTPNALIEFALLRSDGEQIYKSLVRQRKQINEAFSESLLWLREARSSEHPWPYPALAWIITCPGLRDLDREAWPAIQSQMIDAMVRLEQAWRPLIRIPQSDHEEQERSHKEITALQVSWHNHTICVRLSLRSQHSNERHADLRGPR